MRPNEQFLAYSFDVEQWQNSLFVKLLSCSWKNTSLIYN